MAQFLRPTSTIEPGSWTAQPSGTLHGNTGTVTANDSAFAQSDNNTNDGMQLGLSNVDPPDSGTRTLRVRARKDATGGHAMEMIVRVVEDGTVIQDFGSTTNSPVSWTTHEFTLTASVTDWSTLAIEVVRNGATGGGQTTRRHLEVSWIELEVPDAAAATPVEASIAHGIILGHAGTVEVTATSFPVSIAAGADDGHTRESDSTFSSGTTIIEMGRDGSEVERNAYVRFGGLPIPAGSFITSAIITFATGATEELACALLIRAQVADDAAAPTSYAEYHSAPRTTASVTWEPDAWSTTGAPETTDDLSSVVQEVVDRAGWVEGNAILFYVEWVSGSRRRSRSFEHETGPAPSLMVEYSDTEPIEAGIDHGIILGHAVTAEQSITAEADHGIVLGHAGTVTVETPAGLQTFTLPWDSATQPDGPVTITADARDAENNVIGTTNRSFTLENAAAVEATIQHGIVLGHELAAELGVDVAASHGIVLGHNADASLTITADAEHGIILGHAGTANVGSDINAAISHGLVLGHSLEAESGIEASAEHGIVLGHDGAVNVGSDLNATIQHGIILGHSAEAELGVEASAEHGIVLGHDGSVSVGSDVTASVSHGIVLGHDATAELSIEAEASHGIVLGHSAEVNIEAPAEPVEAAISHGIVLGHSGAVTILVPVDAAISHGIVLGHSMSVDVEIIIVPPPEPLTVRRGARSLIAPVRGAASVAQAHLGPRGIVTVRRGPKSTIGG